MANGDSNKNQNLTTTNKTINFENIFELNIENMDIQKIKNSLYIKALGFEVVDSTKEFVVDDNGKMQLVKEKVNTKQVPPDIVAIKFLLELNMCQKTRYDNMTDDELVEEKNRLLNLLKENNEYTEN